MSSACFPVSFEVTFSSPGERNTLVSKQAFVVCSNYGINIPEMCEKMPTMTQETGKALTSLPDDLSVL